MPLSKAEQRTLDEIEQALRATDPKFAEHASFDHQRRLLHRRLVVGAFAFALGLIVLVAGAIGTAALVATGVLISVTGFVVMFAAAAWTLRSPNRR
jgi:Protein of unknown function (DUF3040)